MANIHKQLKAGYSYLVKWGFFLFFLLTPDPATLSMGDTLLLYLCAATAGAGTKGSQQTASNGRNVTIDSSPWCSLFHQGFLLSTHYPQWFVKKAPWGAPATSLQVPWVIFKLAVSYHLQRSPFSTHNPHLPSALGSKYLGTIELWEAHRWLISEDCASQPFLHTWKTGKTYWWWDPTPRNSDSVGLGRYLAAGFFKVQLLILM